MLQQEPSTVLILHLSVARYIVSIMANTSLVSETLLTKRAILSDAYIICTCTCKYSHLILWHIAAPGAVFNHKSRLTDIHYLLVTQVQLLTSNSAPCFHLTKSEHGPYVRPGNEASSLSPSCTGRLLSTLCPPSSNFTHDLRAIHIRLMCAYALDNNSECISASLSASNVAIVLQDRF